MSSGNLSRLTPLVTRQLTCCRPREFLKPTAQHVINIIIIITQCSTFNSHILKLKQSSIYSALKPDHIDTFDMYMFYSCIAPVGWWNLHTSLSLRLFLDTLRNPICLLPHNLVHSVVSGLTVWELLPSSDPSRLVSVCPFRTPPARNSILRCIRGS